MWPNACAAAIRDLFARFQNMSQTYDEGLGDGTIPHDTTANEGTASQTPINSENRPQVATFSAEYEQGNKGLRTAPFASGVGTDVTYNVNREPEGHSKASASRNITISTQTALRDTSDTFLADIFPVGDNIDQTDMTLFQGFDIPFWMDDDLYASLTDTWDFV